MEAEVEEAVGKEGAGEGVGFGVEGGGEEEEVVPEALGVDFGTEREAVGFVGCVGEAGTEGVEGVQGGGEGGVGEGSFDEAGAGAAEGGVLAFEEGAKGDISGFGGKSGEVAEEDEGLFLPEEEAVGLGEGGEPGGGRWGLDWGGEGVAAAQEVLIEEAGAGEGEDVEEGEVVEGAGAHVAEGTEHGEGLEGGDAVGIAIGEGIEGGGVIEWDGGEVNRTADAAEGVEAAAEFIEGVLDGAVLGGVFVVDAKELGGVEVGDVRDAGPLADVDGDVGVGLKGEGGSGAEEEGLGAESVGEWVKVGEAKCVGDGAAGGGAAAGGDGGIELAGGGEAVTREEKGLVPGLRLGTEPGEFLVESGADGLGQGGGPASGGTGVDEGLEFLQGGRGGGCHVSLLVSQTVGCGDGSSDVTFHGCLAFRYTSQDNLCHNLQDVRRG